MVNKTQYDFNIKQLKHKFVSSFCAFCVCKIGYSHPGKICDRAYAVMLHMYVLQHKPPEGSGAV
jgi:hypothetical protein